MRHNSLSSGPAQLSHGSDTVPFRERLVRGVLNVLWMSGCVGLWWCPPCLAQESTPAESVPAAKTPAPQTPAPQTPAPKTPVAKTPVAKTPVATTPAATSPDQGDVTTPDTEGWKPLLDGKSLDGWKITDVGGQGEVTVEDGVVSLGMGATLTGITYAREFPKCDYEFQMEARRVEGVDFFATVTFPVGDSFCSLVVGGWGGGVVGISCINGSDASENETTKYLRFAKGQWYRIRIAVRRDRVQAWIDDQQVVDLETTRRKLSTRVEVYRCQPLGVASWVTRAELRHLRYRRLDPAREPAGEDTQLEESKTGPDRPAAEEKKSDERKSQERKSGAGAVDA